MSAQATHGEPSRGPGRATYLPYQQLPRRRRPSAWWFLLPGVLMAAGLVAGLVLVLQGFQAVQGLTETDATVPADGQPHELVVDTDGERMIWVDPDDRAACTILDRATGEQIVPRGLGGASYSRSTGGRVWEGDGIFDAGSGQLEVTCLVSGGPIQVGPAPELGTFVGSLAAAILVPLALGGGGFVLLIVLTVLYATGRPRDVAAPR